MKEFGLLNKWAERYIGNLPDCYSDKKRTKQSKVNKVKPLTLENLSGVFLISACGKLLIYCYKLQCALIKINNSILNI